MESVAPGGPSAGCDANDISAPARLGAESRVLRGKLGERLIGDHLGTGVDEASRLLAALGVFGDRGDAHRRHLARKLHDRRGGLTLLDVLDAGAAAVDRG